MLIIILLCVSFLLWTLWSWLRPRSPTSPPIYPGALPIIGHAHKLIVSAQDMWSQEKIMYDYCLQNENITEVRIGPHSAFILTDPDDCLTVANKCFEKPYLYRVGKEMYGRSGLVIADESVWKPHRKLLNPAFNLQVLHTYVEEFAIQAKSLVAQLSSEVGTGPFDVQPYLINCMMSTACRTTFGLKTDENREKLQSYAHALEDLFCLYTYRIQRVWLHLPFIFNRSSCKKKEDNLMKVMKGFTKTVIATRKSELKLRGNSDQNQDTESEQFRPLLDHMLDLADKHDAFSEEEIREQTDTMIAGTYDTTATTLTFTLILVGSHPDVQERIYKELQEILGKDKDLNRHDLPKLVYLEAVIKESLRLYPAAPRILRCSSTDVQLKKYILPANSSYLISVYGLNRHPIWGADADQFRPERWLDPASLPANRSAFATFSLGRRNCIGKLYGIMVIKTILAHVLRAYRVKGDIGKVVTRCDVLLKPVSGHEISLESRT